VAIARYVAISGGESEKKRPVQSYRVWVKRK
jgi:hypothetical protein